MTRSFFVLVLALALFGTQGCSCFTTRSPCVSPLNTAQTAELIDLDVDPFIPNGWTVDEHRKGGVWTWNPKKVKLYLSKKQKGWKHIEGNALRTELAKRPVFNANLLDYLLAHHELIPDEWKGKAVFFWGTVYRGPYGLLVVRCLYWRNGRWISGDGCLDNGAWDEACPALVRA